MNATLNFNYSQFESQTLGLIYQKRSVTFVPPLDENETYLLIEMRILYLQLIQISNESN